MSAPLVVNVVGGAVWLRQSAVRDGLALYAPEKCGACPEFVMVTYAELEARGIVGSADVLPVPVPVGSEPQALSAGREYGPVFPWASVMDDEDFYDFRDDLVAATAHRDRERALVEMEKAVSTWRLVAEAQHGHNTAPGPDAVTRVFSSVASLREPEGEFYPFLHREGRVPHDLDETGGV